MTRLMPAAAALVAIGAGAVGEVTRSLLTDPSEQVRATGLLVLRELGPRARTAAAVLLDLLSRATGDERGWLVVALAAVAPEADGAVPALVEGLASEKPDVAYWAGIGLVKVGRAAAPALERARDTATAGVRRRIEEVLRRMPPAGGAPPDRLESFGDDDVLELYAWVGHLLERHGPLPVRRLSRILSGEDPEIEDVHTRISPGVRTSASHVRIAIGALEHELCGDRPLTDRDKGARKGGGLTAEGKALLREVQHYLRRKGRWDAVPT